MFKLVLIPTPFDKLGRIVHSIIGFTGKDSLFKITPFMKTTNYYNTKSS